ncbi:MAG: elongation factor 4 [Candidatus Omnitrophica bacterium]|nr:elongation factor 4 [Candidatus Omnitrophota bacterium]
MDKSLIRNFAIIAHIDHGKSTLADRILEVTNAVDKRKHAQLLLDDMELEKERGITIKASMVRLNYECEGKVYILNLIDTPGHVDFSYEVSKSLAACEGAVLLVDASQGIEAQTVANYYLACESNLIVIPVISKTDLPAACVTAVQKQLVDVFHFQKDEILLISAKMDLGIENVLARIIKVIPPPLDKENRPLAGLVFDCLYDTYKGVIVFVRIIEGKLTPNMQVKFMQKLTTHKIEELGVIENLKYKKVDSLACGEVGYFMANIRNPNEVAIGDTITELKNPREACLPGYRTVKPLVFCGIYPVNSGEFTRLRSAFEKLHLTDASFTYEPENSQSFGSGFRCGFLGLLHMEIIQERLEREYDLNLFLTTPNVIYRIKKTDGQILEIDNPARLPSSSQIAEAFEPYVNLLMIIPVRDMEAICDFAKSRRGTFQSSEFLGEDRIRLNFFIPLSEIIVDFYNKMKSQTHGFGSIDYTLADYQPTKIVKLEIALNDVVYEAFSSLVFKDRAYQKARGIVSKLKELIPRHLFEVRIQARVEGSIIASEKIRALGKHVTGKCYGGDITRKRKLWEIQKKGKKRLKQFGKVGIPQEAFLEVLKI